MRFAILTELVRAIGHRRLIVGNIVEITAEAWSDPSAAFSISKPTIFRGRTCKQIKLTIFIAGCYLQILK